MSIYHGHQFQFVWTFLNNLVVTKQIAHAFLLVGDNNLSLNFFSNMLIKKIVCSNQTSPLTDQCPCATCTSIDKQSYFNLKVLNQDHTLITKNQIDQLCDWFNTSSLLSGIYQSKIGWLHHIEDVHDIAAATLLKTLEEPSQHKFFILTSKHLNQLAPTIVSRCQIIFIPSLTKQTIYEQIMLKKQYYPVDIKLLVNVTNDINEICQWLHNDQFHNLKKTAFESLQWLVEAQQDKLYWLFEAFTWYKTEQIITWFIIVGSIVKALLWNNFKIIFKNDFKQYYEVIKNLNNKAHMLGLIYDMIDLLAWKVNFNKDLIIERYQYLAWQLVN